jgi:hypothetical protein
LVIAEQLSKNYQSQITKLQSLGFLMRGVLAAPAAKLAELQPVRRRLAVLGGRVIPLFARRALQCNDFAGHS